MLGQLHLGWLLSYMGNGPKWAKLPIVAFIGMKENLVWLLSFPEQTEGVDSALPSLRFVQKIFWLWTARSAFAHNAVAASLSSERTFLGECFISVHLPRREKLFFPTAFHSIETVLGSKTEQFSEIAEMGPVLESRTEPITRDRWVPVRTKDNFVCHRPRRSFSLTNPRARTQE